MVAQLSLSIKAVTKPFLLVNLLKGHPEPNSGYLGTLTQVAHTQS